MECEQECVAITESDHLEARDDDDTNEESDDGSILPCRSRRMAVKSFMALILYCASLHSLFILSF